MPEYTGFSRLKLVRTDDMPPVDHPIGDTIRYHIRTGKHDITAYDWQQYLSFADSYLRAKTSATASKPN